MAVSKAKKGEILETLKENLKNAKSIAFTSNVGLTMDDVNNIRANLRKVGGTFMLAKKTLMRKAMKDIYNVDISDDQMPGQVAVVCANEDAIAPLGKVNDSIKEITAKKGAENKIKWVLSYFEGELQDEAATKAIASMPSRETLLGRLVGSMQSPIAGLARFFDAASKKLGETGATSLGNATPAKKAEATPAPVAQEEIKQEEAPQEKTEAEVVTEVEAPAEETPVAVETPETPVQEEEKKAE